MNKNRSIICLPIIFIMMTLTACEDLVDLKPESTISSESFWQNESDVISASYGMYNQFRSTFDVKTVLWGEFRTGYYGQGSSTATDWDDLWNNNMTSSSVGTNWSDMYLLINDANLILSKAPEIAFIDEAARNHIMGQAYFVRAYTYFQIAKLWGDAPIVTEGFESTDQNLEPERRPVAEIYDLVKSDVNEALGLLGERESVNFIGRDAASILKADIYLWTAKVGSGGQNDLLEARAAIDEVMAAGYLLETNFETVFRNENSPEIIFSIFYSELEPGTGNRNGSRGRNQGGTHPSHITLPSLELTPDEFEDQVPTASSPQWLDLSAYFLDNILTQSANDSRTDVTWKSLTTTSGEELSWLNKYIGEVYSGTRLPTTDLIIYRYAEAILLKAEIENALENTGEAMVQLNRIAKRAYGTDNYYTGLSVEQIDDAILQERLLEFVCEGKSWFDIRRFGKAFEMIPSLTGREGENDGNILFFPVAQDVLNRNRSVAQTPGY